MALRMGTMLCAPGTNECGQCKLTHGAFSEWDIRKEVGAAKSGLFDKNAIDATVNAETLMEKIQRKLALIS